jgi:hypothetical protein
VKAYEQKTLEQLLQEYNNAKNRYDEKYVREWISSIKSNK